MAPVCFDTAGRGRVALGYALAGPSEADLRELETALVDWVRRRRPLEALAYLPYLERAYDVCRGTRVGLVLRDILRAGCSYKMAARAEFAHSPIVSCGVDDMDRVGPRAEWDLIMASEALRKNVEGEHDPAVRAAAQRGMCYAAALSDNPAAAAATCERALAFADHRRAIASQRYQVPRPHGAESRRVTKRTASRRVTKRPASRQIRAGMSRRRLYV